MKHISYASIEKAIQVIDNLDDVQLEKLYEDYDEAQPELLGYLMSAALEYENERLEGLILYYYCLISEAFKQEGLTLGKITEKEIEEFEQPYSEMLDAFFENDDEEILEDFCDQPELTRFISIEISEEDEDGTSLDDDTATQLFIVSIAMICLMAKVAQ
jgi:hypothetical protein